MSIGARGTLAFMLRATREGDPHSDDEGRGKFNGRTFHQSDDVMVVTFFVSTVMISLKLQNHVPKLNQLIQNLVLDLLLFVKLCLKLKILKNLILLDLYLNPGM